MPIEYSKPAPTSDECPWKATGLDEAGEPYYDEDSEDFETPIEDGG